MSGRRNTDRTDLVKRALEAFPVLVMLTGHMGGGTRRREEKALPGAHGWRAMRSERHWLQSRRVDEREERG